MRRGDGGKQVQYAEGKPEPERIYGAGDRQCERGCPQVWHCPGDVSGHRDRSSRPCGHGKRCRSDTAQYPCVEVSAIEGDIGRTFWVQCFCTERYQRDRVWGVLVWR